MTTGYFVEYAPGDKMWWAENNTVYVGLLFERAEFLIVIFPLNASPNVQQANTPPLRMLNMISSYSLLWVSESLPKR